MKRWTRLGTAALVACAAAILLVACEEEHEPDARFVSVADIKGFDAAVTSDQYSAGAQIQVFEGLYEFDYLKRPLELVPLLAEGDPEVSADGLVYRFKLRDCVFQDDACFPGGKGRKVVADDFVWCMKRLMAMPNSTGSWIFEGHIVGLDAWMEKARAKLSPLFRARDEWYPFEAPEMRATVAEPVEGLRAIDARTIEVKLTEPYPQFMWTLAMAFTVIYPHEGVEAYGVEWFRHPVGTGPYGVREFWPFERKILFRRNPTWHGGKYPDAGAPGDRESGLLADAGKELPFLDTVEFVTIEKGQPRWLKFLRGVVDRVETEAEIWERAMTPEGKLRDEIAGMGIRVQVEPKGDLAYNGFNMDDPVVGAPAGEKGRKVRQAMCLAFDQDAWFKIMRNGFWARPAYGPVPPTVAGYVAEPKSQYSGQTDLVRAAKLLAEAGYPEGRGLPPLTYEMSGSDVLTRNGAEIFKNSMAKIGIKIELNPNTWDQFDEKVKKRRAQTFGMAWAADYPDAQNFLQLLYGKNVSPGPNGTNYVNSEYDRLYEEMAVMQPGAARDEVIRKMLLVVNEDCPMNYNDHRVQYSYARSWLRNFKFNDINPWIFKYYRIDGDEKAGRFADGNSIR